VSQYPPCARSPCQVKLVGTRRSSRTSRFSLRTIDVAPFSDRTRGNQKRENLQCTLLCCSSVHLAQPSQSQQSAWRTAKYYPECVIVSGSSAAPSLSPKNTDKPL